MLKFVVNRSISNTHEQQQRQPQKTQQTTCLRWRQLCIPLDEETFIPRWVWFGFELGLLFL